MISWFRPRVFAIRRCMTLQQLEERIVLDASVDASAQNNDHETPSETPLEPRGDQASPAETSGTPDSQGGQSSDPLGEFFNQDLSVVLISNALDQLEAISQAVVNDAEIVLCEAENDDMGSIVDALTSLADSTGKQIGHLAILSHGAPGTIALGQDAAFSNLSQGPDLVPWQELRQYLTEDARIDLYGCNTGYGEDGMELVTNLSDLTGATVWASDDDTGSGVYGDWILEVRSDDDSRDYLIDGQADLQAVDNLGTLTVSNGYGWAIAHWSLSDPHCVVDFSHESLPGSNYAGLYIEGSQDINGVDYQGGDVHYTSDEYIRLKGPNGLGGRQEIATFGYSMGDGYYFSDSWDNTFPIVKQVQTVFGWQLLNWDYYADTQSMTFHLAMGNDVAGEEENFQDYIESEYGNWKIGYDPHDPSMGQDNYLTLKLNWLPGPYKTQDFEVEVEEQTTGYSIDLSEYFLTRDDGQVDDFAIDWFYNVYNASFDGAVLTFDTGATDGSNSSGTVSILAYDSDGAWSQHDINVTILESEKVTALPFTVDGVHTDPIYLDGWHTTDIVGGDFEPLQIVVKDPPKKGYLGLEGKRITEGQAIDFEDARDIYYAYWPGTEEQYAVNGHDSMAYSLIYDYDGKMAETQPAAVAIEYRNDPGPRVFEDCEQAWSHPLWWDPNPSVWNQFELEQGDTITMVAAAELHGYIEYNNKFDAWSGWESGILEEGTSLQLTDYYAYYWDKYIKLRYAPDNDFYGDAVCEIHHTVPEERESVVSITVLPRNDEPSIDGDLVLTPDPATEDGSILATGLSISDVDLDYYQGDVNELDYTLQFILEAVGYPDEHPFTLEFDNGLTLTDDGNGMWSVTAGFNDINEALASGLRVDLLDDFHGQVSVTMTALDNGNIDHFFPQESLTDSINWNFTVQPVNDDPSIDMPAALETVEDYPVNLYDVDIYDPDMDFASDRSRPFQITFVATADDSGAASGTLSLLDDSGVTATSPGEGLIALTGTYDSLRKALVTGLEFDPAADFYGDITVRATVSDLGNVGQGDVKGDWSETHITVIGVNDRPVVSIPDDITAMVNSTVGLSMISVDDPDSAYAPPGSQDIQVDVSVDSGSLSLTSPVTVTGDLDGTDGAMRFVGSPNSVNQAFKSLVFSPAKGFIGDVSLTLEVNDNGNYGAETPFKPLSAQASTLISVLTDPLPPPSTIFDQEPIPSFAGTGEPLSTAGLMPEIRNLLGFLSSQSLLPISSLADHERDEARPSDIIQLGISMQEAFFGDTRHQGWDDLLSFVSRKTSEVGEEWLGLEDFLLQLKERQIGETHDQIFLEFNADEVNLAEWFNSLMSSTHDAPGNHQATASEVAVGHA